MNNLKSSNRSTASSSTSSTRHSHTTSSSGNSNTNNNNNNSKTSGSGLSNSAGSKSTSTLKHTHGTTSSTSINHLSHHNNNNTNTNNNNSLGTIGHNSSPILPMTPTSSVSPPVNVICKKEVTGYHSASSGPGISDIMKTTSMHDNVKDDLGMSHNPSAYSNINARLHQGGNLTPLGSNSSIMTTPSPPITPSQNPLSYVPNHDTYFWPPPYNQYANNYNQTASYYSQMDYQSQSNYSMGHSGYSTSNLGLAPSASFNSSMNSQPFASNGIDYMAPQDKYVNMV